MVSSIKTRLLIKLIVVINYRESTFWSVKLFWILRFVKMLNNDFGERNIFHHLQSLKIQNHPELEVQQPLQTYKLY